RSQSTYEIGYSMGRIKVGAKKSDHPDYQSRDKHNEIHLQEIQAGSIMLNNLLSHQNA
ncbi:unnamed protein product, partial [Rotaria sp. Silwood1]